MELYTVDSAGKREFIPPKQYKTLSPFETYEIDSPYFMAIKSGQNYELISDKAFEDKSRNAMITFMQNAGTAFKELDRVIKDGEKVLAEWQGVFDIDDGHSVFFLECKHRVTADMLVKQSMRMEKSMNALKKPQGVGKVFIAAEKWEYGNETQTAALRNFGYGVLYENGNDLSVRVE